MISAITRAIGTAALLVAASASAAGAQRRLSQQEALRLAFPRATTIERRTAFLTDEDLARASELAGDGVSVTRRIVTYYVGLSDDGPVGVAYFDAHRVRTLNEVLMIVVAPNEEIERIEILMFAEPPEYRAPPDWLEQLEDQPLTSRLSLKGSVINLTGATLTARAAVRAARRVLALHRVIRALEEWEGNEP
ncbi:MAG: hypothetical protein ACE5PT_04220 [Gemmatimonadales bacterium]